MELDFLRPQSKAHFATLNSDAKPIFEEFLKLCHDKMFNVQVTSGSRTAAEQDALYEIGREKPGKIITAARGGESSHNYGIAIDVVVLNKDGECDWRTETYGMLWTLAKEAGLDKKGLRWAGEWKSFKEAVHFDLGEGHSIAALKEKYPLYVS
jgi:peptidoglycan L-alanyl-D-glutamate endopeptidase CwlK